MPFGSWPLLILMAKSEIRIIHVWWTVENLVFQHTGGRENDFASSIAFGECQVIAQTVARRLLVPPLITRGFEVAILRALAAILLQLTWSTKIGQEPGCCGENAIPLCGRRDSRTWMF